MLRLELSKPEIIQRAVLSPDAAVQLLPRRLDQALTLFPSLLVAARNAITTEAQNPEHRLTEQQRDETLQNMSAFESTLPSLDEAIRTGNFFLSTHIEYTRALPSVPVYYVNFHVRDLRSDARRDNFLEFTWRYTSKPHRDELARTDFLVGEIDRERSRVTELGGIALIDFYDDTTRALAIDGDHRLVCATDFPDDYTPQYLMLQTLIPQITTGYRALVNGS